MQKGTTQYRLFRPGDLNAFFGLMLDNLTQLVILAGILVGVLGFPKELVLTRIIPGSAIGVLIGDLIYTRMAVQLARKTGRANVTESAAAGGDEYNTRDIVLTDGLSTLIGGLCGGVVQTTPFLSSPTALSFPRSCGARLLRRSLTMIFGRQQAFLQ